jgi:prepilin-type processing-associated H-X9-DG protein
MIIEFLCHRLCWFWLLPFRHSLESCWVESETAMNPRRIWFRHPDRHVRKFRGAITVIELVVSIAVVGILLSLALAGVQSARESARQVQCQNNLKQIGIAAQNHLSTSRAFPSGGWGYQWMGVASQGLGKSQPGGWCFSLLTLLEADNVFNIVANPDQARTDLEAVRLLAETRPAVFACPARDTLTDVSDTFLYYGIHTLTRGAHTDYAVNGGSRFYIPPPGPADFEDAVRFRFPSSRDINGICWFASEVRERDIIDGLSNTFFAGEKWVPLKDPGEERNQPLYAGDCFDVRRFTQNGPRPDRVDAGGESTMSFGSRHNSGVNFNLCDGSTRLISYRVDELVYAALGNRRDGSRIGR